MYMDECDCVWLSVCVCLLIFSVFRKQPAIYEVYILATECESEHEFQQAHTLARTQQII